MKEGVGVNEREVLALKGSEGNGRSGKALRRNGTARGRRTGREVEVQAGWRVRKDERTAVGEVEDELLRNRLRERLHSLACDGGVSANNRIAEFVHTVP